MNKSQSRVNLLGMTTSEIEALVQSAGQPRFRGRQIAGWLYKRNANSIEDMSDLPTAFRAKLGELATLFRSKIATSNASPDGTTKFLLELEDGERIESVLLPYKDRVSVCLSSQVGCAAGCVFCATGIGGMVRNLGAGEIVDEVLTLQRESAKRISHVVYMGMGEPLLNYDNVLKSVHLLSDEVGIAMRHITVSTVGITPKIEDLAREDLQLTLAVSLHAPNDLLRNKLIPIASRYPLAQLLRVCREYTSKTRRRITFEYMLIGGVNDSVALAKEVVALLRGMLCNVNLIPYNAVEGVPMKRPTQPQIKAFRAVLEDGGIDVTQRMERGHSISAACGQLRRRNS